MILPNVWGQGQLFAFSALDGDSFSRDDLAGILSGDKIGVRFFTKVKRELALILSGGPAPEFDAVTGDVISLRYHGEELGMVFAERHLVCGTAAGGAAAACMVEGICRTEYRAGIEIHDTGDGEFTALAREGNRFAFAFAQSLEDAVSLARRGIAIDANAVKEERLCMYRKHFLPEEHPYAQLYAKCISVLKTQLYTPEGQIRHTWSTPDRLPHKYMWLWDSVFHSVGWRNLDGKLAEDLILAVFDAQREDGFIPHMAAPDMATGITQPPVLGWGALKVFEKTGNRDFLRTVFEKNRRFLNWCVNRRRRTDEMLFSWNTEDDINCRCGESGMDNSPRFDAAAMLQTIDFSCFMANDARCMQKMAEILELSEEAQEFANFYREIKTAVNEKLWCPEDGFYYDYDILTEKIHKVRTVASFLPLFAGICEEKQAQKLVRALFDPEDFKTPLMIPSVSRKEETFGTDMWRGSVWINFNYMITQGLKEFGFAKEAEEIAARTLETLKEWYVRKGVIYEFYDWENKMAPCELKRKGPVYEPYDFTIRSQSVRDYGWTCALAIDWLENA